MLGEIVPCWLFWVYAEQLTELPTMEVINNEKKIDLGLALGDENIHPNVQVNLEFLIFNSSMRIFNEHEGRRFIVRFEVPRYCTEEVILVPEIVIGDKHQHIGMLC